MKSTSRATFVNLSKDSKHITFRYFYNRNVLVKMKADPFKDYLSEMLPANKKNQLWLKVYKAIERRIEENKLTDFQDLEQVYREWQMSIAFSISDPMGNNLKATKNCYEFIYEQLNNNPNNLIFNISTKGRVKTDKILEWLNTHDVPYKIEKYYQEGYVRLLFDSLLDDEKISETVETFNL